MPDITMDKFPSSTPASSKLIPMYDISSQETQKATVEEVRNIAVTINEGGTDKAASNENLKSVNDKIDLLSQSVDSSFQTVNQNFVNVENEISSANTAIGTANQNITNHEEDSSVHVTPEKKTEWNKNTTDIVNLATQLLERVNKTSIINNLSVTEEGFVLDARQGKVIKDELDTKAYKPSTLTYKLYVADNCDFNTLTETGIYQIPDSTNMTNKPSIASWSILEVVATNSYVKQTITNASTGVMWVRTLSSTWSAWRQL